MDCGMFSIQLMEEKQYGFYITRKITVTNKKVQFYFSPVKSFHTICQGNCHMLFAKDVKIYKIIRTYFIV